jgi:hypothetical protein
MAVPSTDERRFRSLAWRFHAPMNGGTVHRDGGSIHRCRAGPDTDARRARAIKPRHLLEDPRTGWRGSAVQRWRGGDVTERNVGMSK